MDPTTDTSSSGGFLGDLSSILTGYLTGRANILLNQQSGGQYIPNYIDTINQTGGTPSPVQTPGTPLSNSFATAFKSPTVWIGLAVVAVLVIVLVKGRK